VTTPADTLRTIFQASVASKGAETRKAYLRSLQRLAAWAQSEGTDTEDLQAAALERFLAEEGRQYARGTLEVRLAALRAFYRYLHSIGLLDEDPTNSLSPIPPDRGFSNRPIAHLTEYDLAQLRVHAEKLGPEHSLAICLLHETPISVLGIARLSVDNLAERRQRTFVLLGQTPASKQPWSVSEQARRAIDALRSDDHPRLISPLTKNPNTPKVLRVLGETQTHAKVVTPDLPAALKGVQRREEQELCAQLRLKPKSLAEHRRRLLAGLEPLDNHPAVLT
jgi:site-specific recombinase XerD